MVFKWLMLFVNYFDFCLCGGKSYLSASDVYFPYLYINKHEQLSCIYICNITQSEYTLLAFTNGNNLPYPVDFPIIFRYFELRLAPFFGSIFRSLYYVK